MSQEKLSLWYDLLLMAKAHLLSIYFKGVQFLFYSKLLY